MSASDRTGLSTYDIAKWHVPPPDADHVVEDRETMGFLLQTHSLAQVSGFVEVPPADVHYLILALPGMQQRQFSIGDDRYWTQLPPGGLIHIPVGHPNRFEMPVPTFRHRFAHMHLRPAFLSAVATQEGLSGPVPTVPIGHTDPVLQGMVVNLEREAGATGEPSRLAWECLSTVVALWLLRFKAPAPRRQGRLAGWQLKRVVEYLRAHACEEVSLQTLCALVDLSPFHFARAFKATTGVPPHRYQLMLRYAQACRLLKQPELSILDVAVSLGYQSSQPLARLFAREAGTTPSAYRREHCPGAPVDVVPA